MELDTGKAEMGWESMKKSLPHLRYVRMVRSY